MKSKGGVHPPRKGYYNMYNFYMVKMFGIFKYSGSLYVRTGTDTARNIFTKKCFCFS